MTRFSYASYPIIITSGISSKALMVPPITVMMGVVPVRRI